jgi:hypothetical protein
MTEECVGIETLERILDGNEHIKLNLLQLTSTSAPAQKYLLMNLDLPPVCTDK